jgi:hypothetical protein
MAAAATFFFSVFFFHFLMDSNDPAKAHNSNSISRQGAACVLWRQRGGGACGGVRWRAVAIRGRVRSVLRPPPRGGGIAPEFYAECSAPPFVRSASAVVCVWLGLLEALLIKQKITDKPSEAKAIFTQRLCCSLGLTAGSASRLGLSLGWSLPRYGRGLCPCPRAGGHWTCGEWGGAE